MQPSEGMEVESEYAEEGMEVDKEKETSDAEPVRSTQPFPTR